MRPLIRRYLPHLVLGLSISLIMVGAYMAVGFAQNSAPKTTWAVNPLTITFPGSSGTGSAVDSFTCSPSSTNILLVANCRSNELRFLRVHARHCIDHRNLPRLC